MNTLVEKYPPGVLIEKAVLPTLALLFFTVIGVFGNISIVYVTIKWPRFHQPSNILIGIRALFDILHQLTHLMTAYLIFSKTNYVAVSRAFWMLLIPAVGMMFGTFLTFVIGLDRLLAVLFPKFYWKIKSSKYIGLIFFFGGIYIIGLFTATYYFDKDVQTLIVVNPGSIFYGPSEILFIVSQVIFISLAILVYILIWIIAFFAVKSKPINIRLLKPITVILIFIVIGWVFNLVYGMYLKTIDLQTSDEEAYVINHMYAGISINLGVASDYFVYFIFSKDYRTAFRKQLRIFRTKSTIHSNLNPEIQDRNKIHVAVCTAG